MNLTNLNKTIGRDTLKIKRKNDLFEFSMEPNEDKLGIYKNGVLVAYASTSIDYNTLEDVIETYDTLPYSGDTITTDVELDLTKHEVFDFDCEPSGATLEITVNNLAEATRCLTVDIELTNTKDSGDITVSFAGDTITWVGTAFSDLPNAETHLISLMCYGNGDIRGQHVKIG